MKLLIQRVKSASVTVEGEVVGAIHKGLLVFLGISKTDNEENCDFHIKKLLSLRLFPDEKGKMNLSVQDIEGEILLVSQFTLYGNCQKGRRPSFDRAASPERAKLIYDAFLIKLKSMHSFVESGQFQASMDVSLVNDGPVTFILES